MSIAARLKTLERQLPDPPQHAVDIKALLAKLGIPGGLPAQHAAEGARILKACVSTKPADLTPWHDFVKEVGNAQA